MACRCRSAAPSPAPFVRRSGVCRPVKGRSSKDEATSPHAIVDASPRAAARDGRSLRQRGNCMTEESVSSEVGVAHTRHHSRQPQHIRLQERDLDVLLSLSIARYLSVCAIEWLHYNDWEGKRNGV